MIAMAWKHPNVYIGLDAYAPKHWPASIQHFINTFGQDKVLFGSDWPVIDPERAVDDVEALAFRPAPLRKMMRDNVIRVFRLEGRLQSTNGDDPAVWQHARDEVGRR
jgi:predicted TIM-barrel fold metal-dependent hydrolase